MDECVRREVEEVGVGGVVREFFEWAFVWGDVDPHGGGLSASEPDGCTCSRSTCHVLMIDGFYLY